jgi:UDP:flavonoid glycosyltransferase YjiC (YdhE family)
MRVLISCTSGDGHFYPLLPLAHALRRRGHDVAFAMAAEYARRIESADFSWLPSGIGLADLNARQARRLTGRPDLTSPEYLPFVIATRYGLGDAPDRLADLQDLTASWRPDLIIFEPCDLAAPIAAAALGVPTVHHSFGRALAADCYERSAEHVQPLWKQVGLTMPVLCGMYSGQYVDICPPSLQRRSIPPSARVLPLRPMPPPQEESTPAWLLELPDRSNVYVTLGTVFNDMHRLRLLLEACADIDANVIMTIGRDNEPADLGVIPENAVVERFIPQEMLLPHMSAVLSHAGSGSMLAALSHGLPMVMLPQGADQFENAHACDALGVARWVAAEDVDVDVVRRELSTVLSEPSYSQSAVAMRKEISAMPGPDAVAGDLSRTC